jgi:hypothetical protein
VAFVRVLRPGWPDPLFADATAHAREIRNRYTFLDFA